MYFNKINRQSGSTWRDQLAEMKTARAEYAELEPIMSAAERVMYIKSINDKQAAVGSTILQGAFTEWDNALDKFTNAVKSVQTAKNKEIARWEAVKLNAEMQMAESLITKLVQSSAGERLEPDVLPRLQKMYDEAQASGDVYKMRATAEVFTGLPAMVGSDFEDRKAANKLSKQAQRDARVVRITPEMKAADQAAVEAVEMINQAKSLLFEVDEGLGYTKPNGEVGNFDIFKQLHRIRSKPDGEIESIVPIDQALNPDV